MRYNVIDDDGLIALVNANRYETFVNSDWSLEQLKSHFIEQMNKNNLIIWQTSNDGGGIWGLEVYKNTPSENKSFREFNKKIEITSGKLYIVTYTDLTMAAQYEDEKIPSETNANLCIEIENGIYDVTVRQMFQVEKDISHGNNIFEIIFNNSTNLNGVRVKSIFWWE
jgi:hypothetical protein